MVYKGNHPQMALIRLLSSISGMGLNTRARGIKPSQMALIQVSEML